MRISTQRELEAPKRTERAWSKSATDHCWGCGAGQLSIRSVRWLYQRGEECKGLSHCANMSNEEELRAQYSTAKRKQKCKHGKHLKAPEFKSHHEEPAVNLANKLILYHSTILPNFLDDRLLPAASTITCLSANFNEAL